MAQTALGSAGHGNRTLAHSHVCQFPRAQGHNTGTTTRCYQIFFMFLSQINLSQDTVTDLSDASTAQLAVTNRAGIWLLP